MDRFKTVYLDGFEEDYYLRYADAIRSVSPGRIKNLAEPWLQRTDFTELVVGKM
jgi:hypothetical protein